MLIAPTSPQWGIQPATIDGRVWNRTGATLAVGDLCCLNLQATGAETTTITTGGEDSVWGNVTVVDNYLSGGTALTFFCVALESIADDQPGRVRFQGIVDANVFRATTDTTVGMPLVPSAGEVLDGTPAAGELRIAIALEAVDADPAVSMKVFLNGLGGGWGPEPA